MGLAGGGSFKTSLAQVPWATASGLEGRGGQVKPLVLGPGALVGPNCLVSPSLKQTLWEDGGPSSQARLSLLPPSRAA